MGDGRGPLLLPLRNNIRTHSASLLLYPTYRGSIPPNLANPRFTPTNVVLTDRRIRMQTFHRTVLTLLFVAVSTNFTLAQKSVDSARLPLTFFQKITPRTGRAGEFTSGGKTNNAGIKAASVSSGIPGIDSVVNWSDEFMATGFDSNGNPQSIWPYTMVGHPPESGIPAFIGAPVVPVSVDLLGPD